MIEVWRQLVRAQPARIVSVDQAYLWTGVSGKPVEELDKAELADHSRPEPQHDLFKFTEFFKGAVAPGKCAALSSAGTGCGSICEARRCRGLVHRKERRATPKFGLWAETPAAIRRNSRRRRCGGCASSILFCSGSQYLLCHPRELSRPLGGVGSASNTQIGIPGL